MSARDDYRLVLRDLVENPQIAWYACSQMLDEIDRLRLLNGRLERDFADMNNARRNLDTGKVRSPVFCDATHPDTECEGWIWYCSLIAGHLGPHHCAGAAW